MDRLLGEPTEADRSSPDAPANVEEGRTAQKRRAIRTAAAEVFLQHGYLGASMDEVAAKAAVSKQTVYKQFGDKEHLFAEIILGTFAQLKDEFARVYASTIEDATDMRQAFRDLARWFLDTLTQPHIIQLRRLVIAEADRFPDVAAAWFDGAFHRTLVLLGESMTRLADRGMLRELADPTLAAYQFAGLVMYKPMNQLMFAGTEAPPSTDELEQIADRAAEVFLTTYGRS